MLLPARNCVRFRLALLAALTLLSALLPTVTRANNYGTPSYRARLLIASGVEAREMAAWCDQLDAWGRELQSVSAVTETERAVAIHTLLHERMLTGKYRPSASHLGRTLSGGSFNCAVTTALFLDLAAQCGLPAQAVSVAGHVWCRVITESGPLNIETTCADWFAILDRYHGLPDSQISAAMTVHRQRQAVGRVLNEQQLLAIFHFNRGVTLWRERNFAGAARANAQAVWLDPGSRVAWENLLAALHAAGQTSSLAAAQ